MSGPPVCRTDHLRKKYVFLLVGERPDYVGVRSGSRIIGRVSDLKSGKSGESVRETCHVLYVSTRHRESHTDTRYRTIFDVRESDCVERLLDKTDF